jgi:D-alanine-D-alanine ligase
VRIAVVHNRVASDAPPDEADVLCQADEVSEALRRLGHKPVRLSCGLNLAAIRSELRAIGPDLVFNLVESLDGSGSLIHLFPSLLDALKLPYTGSGASALMLTSNKVLAKTLLAAAGLPTPAWRTPESTCSPRIGSPAAEMFYDRWIVKSVWEHASIGLDADAVVVPAAGKTLDDILASRTVSLGGACFAEAYIDGREFNLSLLEVGDDAIVLPPAEIRFDGFDDSQPRIMGYQAKWEASSFQYQHTQRCFDMNPEDEALLQSLEETALACWRCFDLNGYARVDFRVDSRNRPWILEVNANPCLSADAGFAAAVYRSDRHFDQAIHHILEAAGPHQSLHKPQERVAC